MPTAPVPAKRSIQIEPTSAAGSWRQHLEAVGFYFRGYRKQADSIVNKLGSESATEAILRAIVEHRAQCLHVALLAEAALRSGDFLTAAIQTVTSSPLVTVINPWKVPLS